MKQVKFDTLKYVNKLEVLGIPRHQAEGQVALLTEVFNENLATKEDITALRSDITADIKALKGDMSLEFAQIDVKFAQVDVKFADLKSEMNDKFADLKRDMDVKFAETRTELSEFKTMIKWLLGIMLGLFATQTGVIFSLLKIWH